MLWMSFSARLGSRSVGQQTCTDMAGLTACNQQNHRLSNRSSPIPLERHVYTASASSPQKPTCL